MAGVLSQELIQRAVLHELRDNHDRHALGDDALKIDDVRVIELSHDGGFGEEIVASLVRTVRFESFDGYRNETNFAASCLCAQEPFADISKFPGSYDTLDTDGIPINFSRELLHSLLRVFVGVRINVQAAA